MREFDYSIRLIMVYLSIQPLTAKVLQPSQIFGAPQFRKTSLHH